MEDLICGVSATKDAELMDAENYIIEKYFINGDYPKGKTKYKNIKWKRKMKK
jgi:hypothetical protein